MHTPVLVRSLPWWVAQSIGIIDGNEYKWKGGAKQEKTKYYTT